MPKKFPIEFQRDVVAVARRRGAPRAEIAADFGISESTLKRWIAQADIDDGVKDGQPSRPRQPHQPAETIDNTASGALFDARTWRSIQLRVSAAPPGGGN